MKKTILTSLLVFLLSLNALTVISAVSPSPSSDEEEIVVDYECYQAKLLGGGKDKDSEFAEKCSIKCMKSCLYAADPKTGELTVRQNKWCTGGEGTTQQLECNGSSDEDIDTTAGLVKVNFFGIDADLFMLVLIRRVILGVMGAAGIVVIAGGIYGMYKYSFADGNQEKIQEAMKIFKSLLIGAIIVFIGVSGVQIAALVSGVTGDLFDFNFLPRSGRVVFLNYDDLGKACLPEQKAAPTGPLYYCDPTEKIWVKNLPSIVVTP